MCLFVCLFVFHFYSNIIEHYLENSEDPDSAASDLGLHCSRMSQKKDASLIWVKLGTFANNIDQDEISVK